MVTLVIAASAAGAGAHVLYERATLREGIVQADLVVVAEFETDAQTWEAEDGSDRQEWFGVRIVETLRGEAPGPTLDFFPHAEGFPAFRRGDRALLFLGRSSSRPEFAALEPRFRWFSGQGAGYEWILVGADGEAIVEIARRWVALAATPDDALSAFRALVLAELASGVPRLRRDALRELILVRSVPGLLDASTTEALAAWAAAPGLPGAERLALVRLLDGAPGFDASQLLRALAREPLDDPTRNQLIRVAATSPDPVLRAWAASGAEVLREAPEASASAAAPAAGPGIP